MHVHVDSFPCLLIARICAFEEAVEGLSVFFLLALETGLERAFLHLHAALFLLPHLLGVLSSDKLVQELLL